jgi:YD repeat-containing protein
MGRLSTMHNLPYAPYTSGVQYNASDQMTQITYFGISETRSYNTMNQVASIAANGFSEQYNYTSGTNNGQISSVVEGTGETVSYQYDKLKRLITATSTVWGQQLYTYDGFGNMTSKTGSFNVLINAATNRMTGFNYDLNPAHSGLHRCRQTLC